MQYRRVFLCLLVALGLGATGASGAADPSGALAPSYAYIFDTRDSQVVTKGGNVLFGQNGTMTADMSHAPGTAGITVGSAGTYRISLQMKSVSDSSRAYRGDISPFFIQINGLATPPAGATFAVPLSFAPLVGDVILPLAARDVITVHNLGEDAMLNNDEGGVAVGLTIVRLGS